MSRPLPPPTDDDFFGAVEQYLTPAMAAHGYVVCAVGEGKASDPSASILRRVPNWRTHWLFRRLSGATLRTRWVRHLSVGYEGGDSGNEYWAEYFPERQGLDLLCWRGVLGERADFDVSGTEPVDRDELRRRLRILAEAVSAADTLEDS